jgi:plasmid stabilization system protein ParE
MEVHSSEAERRQGEIYLLGINLAMMLLRDHPRLGRNVHDVRPGYFKFPALPNVVYYRLSSDTLDTISILHKNMDAEQHFLSASFEKCGPTQKRPA